MMYEGAEIFVSKDSDDRIRQVTTHLIQTGKSISCAESCTGGLLSARLTDRAGSSLYMMGGVVSYTNAVKVSLVGVQETTLDAHGAVSEETAREMAEGIRTRIHTDYGVGITGIAGPGGATETKPVGLVYIGVASAWNTMITKNVFTGNRASVRYQATEKALQMLMEMFAGESATEERKNI
ncbi:hypothetical protein TAMA11512_14560 [Selenomonas sp. TAMA-11512]|uniref:CinA family protein n=1 Tax=Selenomonas sp. TAMA-11512 TaxID=3095337 RepID=UPI00308C08F7|nr:hypothetical protein TAMA11512_14560 [Selenomonas sp. TAMA-11512]